ncbi:hypothetical protein TrVFT333_005189 [Trichoderma virens FT-333]|nr:hypothetical protein TrVFT333_005189 [Trichoderma virens FT-333]
MQQGCESRWDRRTIPPTRSNPSAPASAGRKQLSRPESPPGPGDNCHNSTRHSDIVLPRRNSRNILHADHSVRIDSDSKKSAAWNLLKSQAANVQPFEKHQRGAQDRLADFEKEFAALPDESNEFFKDDERLAIWRSKLKQYMILSSAGKPIWSRHGDLNLINSSIGVVQTIISFYEGSKNPLQGFTAGNTRFVVLTQGPLYFVAISKLGESDSQLRVQLEAFDLQLIFNMLFESEGIKAGGGENWIPLCLPAFNNKGYLYMYVSFFEGVSGEQATAPAAAVGQPVDEEIAMILISADREAFFSLKQMRDDVAQQLAKNGSLAIIRDAARAGRPSMGQIAPGSPICHFLFKSRANVQFCMSALEPAFGHLVKRRRLMTVYHELHASTHAKNAHLKILQCVSDDATSLAWLTPTFELYCIGGPNLSRAAMAQGANKIMQWIKREEQRLFIIGGGVF